MVPTAGNAAMLLLVADGAPAGLSKGLSAARTALMEAAATRTAHAIFFISIVLI